MSSMYPASGDAVSGAGSPPPSSFSVGDSGTGTETRSLSAIDDVVDSATGNQGTSVLGATDTAVDSAVGSEGTSTLSAIDTATDSGTGNQGTTILSAIDSAVDSAVGNESRSLSITDSATDSGTGNQGTTVLSATDTATDSGTGNQGTTVLSATDTASDSATGSEIGIHTDQLVLDTGTGSEGPRVVSATGPIDSGTGSDSHQVVDLFHYSELTHLGPLSTSPLSSLEFIDQGTFAQDSSTGSDASSALVVSTTVVDSGTGSEVATLVSVLTSDSGTGSETSPQISASITTTDSAVGDDSSIFDKFIDTGDSAVGSESATVLNTTVDTGTGVESDSQVVVVTSDSVVGTDAHVEVSLYNSPTCTVSLPLSTNPLSSISCTRDGFLIDQCVGSETVGSVSNDVIVSDSCNGSDQTAPSDRSSVGSDYLINSEIGILVVAITSVDSATGYDVSGTGFIAYADDDSAVGLDSASPISASLDRIDLLIGTETSRASQSSSDSGSGTDTRNVPLAILVSDSAVGSQQSGGTSRVSTDFAYAVDDEIGKPSVVTVYPAGDSAIGSDSGSVGDRNNCVDSAVGSELSSPVDVSVVDTVHPTEVSLISLRLDDSLVGDDESVVEFVSNDAFVGDDVSTVFLIVADSIVGIDLAAQDEIVDSYVEDDDSLVGTDSSSPIGLELTDDAAVDETSTSDSTRSLRDYVFWSEASEPLGLPVSDLSVGGDESTAHQTVLDSLVGSESSQLVVVSSDSATVTEASFLVQSRADTCHPDESSVVSQSSSDSLVSSESVSLVSIVLSDAVHGVEVSLEDGDLTDSASGEDVSSLAVLATDQLVSDDSSLIVDVVTVEEVVGDDASTIESSFDDSLVGDDSSQLDVALEVSDEVVGSEWSVVSLSSSDSIVGTELPSLVALQDTGYVSESWSIVSDDDDVDVGALLDVGSMSIVVSDLLSSNDFSVDVAPSTLDYITGLDDILGRTFDPFDAVIGAETSNFFQWSLPGSDSRSVVGSRTSIILDGSADRSSTRHSRDNVLIERHEGELLTSQSGIESDSESELQLRKSKNDQDIIKSKI